MLWMCSAILKLAGSLGGEEEGVMTTWPMESRTGRGDSRTGPQKSLIADRGQRATPALAIATPARTLAKAKRRIGRRVADGGTGAGATTATSKSALRDGM